MIPCTINGSPTYVHRVRDLAKAPKPLSLELATQFREAIQEGLKAGKVSYPERIGRFHFATCACGQSFVVRNKAKQCADCEAKNPTPPKVKPELPNLELNKPKSRTFVCPYCLAKNKRTRKNQATCNNRECQRKHWAILKRINRY